MDLQMDMWRACKLAVATVVSLWAGLHTMIQLLVYAMAFDLATGVIAGWMDKTVSSEIGRKGLAKKLMILLGVAAAEIAGKHIGWEISMPWGGVWSIGAAVAGYYCVQEVISITENISRAGVPLPTFVVERLKQFNERGDTK